ncbi:MalY/PatB family protein [Deinococcus yavapaiensis]|uniref:cysteine-S-conjugate beta-lyase n=1 Tax=Deinococcus yavapaiensis KR-236 TaxID=694435 RepID=A0A318SEM6_9DEIO|nr:PatB family C-S lyase [Deinococcus yavapaiensis]PYE56237.1 cystathionine beta-lyase [Deinococcus yavapaiensis KR-236]
MPFSFDVEESVVRHPASAKWSMFAEDVLPLWVADMDFPVAPPIVEALRRRLDLGLGYSPFEGEKTLVDALTARHGVAREGLMLLPGVVSGLYASVRTFASPGEEVMSHVPIYPPFMSAIRDTDRAPILVPLVEGANRYEIDFDAMQASVTPATRLLMLCNPHNPTGRTWTREELERVAEFALRHRLWVVSDELHADLTLDGGFVAFASLAAEVAARTVTLTGPCKAFNTAGLGIGAAVSSNAALIARMKKVAAGTGHPSALAQTMWHAAITEGEPWLRDVLNVLRARRDFLADLVRARLPEARFLAPQATYLAWLDLRALNLPTTAGAFLLERAKVALNDGPTFGPSYEGFARLNFATSEAVLAEAIERIVRAIRS